MFSVGSVYAFPEDVRYIYFFIYRDVLYSHAPNIWHDIKIETNYCN